MQKSVIFDEFHHSLNLKHLYNKPCSVFLHDQKRLLINFVSICLTFRKSQKYVIYVKPNEKWL